MFCYSLIFIFITHTSFKLKSPSYCFKSEFFGSVNTRTRSSFVRLFTLAKTGNRPTNSGIKPYCTKSK